MSPLLFIPWFKAEPIYIPLPFDIPVLPHGLPIQPFGILVAIGVLLGIRMCEEFAKRNGISPLAAYDFAMYTVVPGFVGAYVLNVVFYDPELLLAILRDPRNFRWTGISSYGGFFGAAFGIFLWWRKHRIPLLAISDSAVFGLVFGWIFGRMGCFVVHDHPGRVTDFPLAVADYHAGEMPYQPRHDLGFYEMLWAMALGAIFLVMWRKPNRRPGTYLATTTLLYAPFRFMLDFLRAEVEEGGDVRYFGLTPGHYSSIAFLAFGIYVARRVYTYKKEALPPEIAIETATIGTERIEEPTPKSEASATGSAAKQKSKKKKR